MAGWMKGGEVKDDRKRETKEEERTNKKSGNQNGKVEKEKEGGWMEGLVEEPPEGIMGWTEKPAG